MIPYIHVCNSQTQRRIKIFDKDGQNLAKLDHDYKNYKQCKSIFGGNQAMIRNCMSDENDCDPNPCNPDHSFQCVDLYQEAKCECNAGYGGTTCDIVTNWCETNPCKNGYCDLDGDSYICTCDDYYQGKNCDVEILDCRRADLDEYQCGPHGNCVVTDEDIAQATCECDTGFVGDKCDIDEDECDTGNHKCDSIHGRCNNVYGDYECKCDAGFMVTKKYDCEDINECNIEGICTRDTGKGGCVNTIGSYKCMCYDGYKLDIMTQKECYDIDECAKEC